MVRIIWTRSALVELRAIEDYIRYFSSLAGERMAVRLLNAGESLHHFPSRGRPISQNRRELTIVPPYLIRYRVEDDAVRILEIRHGARDPDA